LILVSYSEVLAVSVLNIAIAVVYTITLAQALKKSSHLEWQDKTSITNHHTVEVLLH